MEKEQEQQQEHDSENEDALFVFGYGLTGHFPASLLRGADRHSRGSRSIDVKKVSTPMCALRAPGIQVVWASWCDAIFKINGTYHYYGTSFPSPSQVQQPHDSSDSTLNHTPHAAIQAISSISGDLPEPPIFFGRRDTLGVLGFILPSEDILTILHDPEAEVDTAAPGEETSVSTRSFAALPWRIRDVQFTASEAVFVALEPRDGSQEVDGMVLEISSLRYLLQSLSAQGLDQGSGVKRADFAPTSCATNSTILTAVSPEGKVHTLAIDRRFPRAAGRDTSLDVDVGAGIAQAVPFLEETVITKVAAGGLYTAAFSDDGELYLWGQAEAGMRGELRCLQRASEDDDDYVRTVDMGADARVVDVSIGNAHVLVAVEVGGTCRMFAAGDNSCGALGIGEETEDREFVEEFVPVEALDGMRVKQLTCAGMSSFVVVGSE